MPRNKANEQWQRYVKSLLGQGWGVEDISVKMGCDIEHVRAEVQILRQSGALKRVYNRIRLNSRKPLVTHDG